MLSTIASNAAAMTSMEEDGNCLVVVFLRGGADSLTLLPPVEDDTYHSVRPQIGIKKQAALPLDGLFALHPMLAPLQQLFHEGELLLIQGAGSEDESRSHFEAQDFMEHGGTHAGGWLGRFLRAAGNAQGAQQSGAIQAVALGQTLPESLRGSPGTLAVESLKSIALDEGADAFIDALDILYSHEKDALGAAGQSTVTGMRRLSQLTRMVYAPEHGAAYPEDAFGQHLAQVAQLIKARVGVRAAVLDLEGWDAHFAMDSLMSPLMQSLGRGLRAFHTDLGAARMQQTTLVVMSEFGRRVYENASYGSDHGRGGFMALLGGGVRGGRVLHQWEGTLPAALEGPGDLPVHYNFRDVLAPVLLRQAQLETLQPVFPGHMQRAVTIF